MAKRTDIKSVLVIGAGPIIIGQGCEFDYSGAQACKALREEGYSVILVNSNPATIMTDPNMADAVYIEPIHWQVVANIIEKEHPCALLPTMGGQTALNCALDLVREGVLERHSVELIGASEEAIEKAENRQRFREVMKEIGLKMPRSAIAHSLEEAKHVQPDIGFPSIIRPSFTLGGSGGGIAYNQEEFEEICKRGLACSPTQELLIEQSIIGWKEFEMEVVRDKKDNCIIVCSIENLDPMGVHTGDSITVAPIQTLTDKEYQHMRDCAIKVLRHIGVETGGANVQFAVDPKTGELHVIEMNPRVSRSSALASKATGFPIARIAAKLAIGYTLDELGNEITSNQTPASFEPSMDYVVTKIPRFNFEKFPQADPTLTTQMKSVGEVMAIGRTFQESLQKAIRGLEVGLFGLESSVDVSKPQSQVMIRQALQQPTSQRLWHIADAFRIGMSVETVHELTGVDPWFLAEIEAIIETEAAVIAHGEAGLTAQRCLSLKRDGFSDVRLAQLVGITEQAMRSKRHAWGIRPVYKHVDSCAAEFSVSTGYFYSTYEKECEVQLSERRKIVVLGGGPNRIGQGIEFDYCCVHAAQAVREAGYEAIMINCNPETVSTDYDVSDRLYFESLTLEDVLEIIDREKPLGVILQFGGQTPLKLARDLERAGVVILGTSPDAIDRAEDRGRFQQMIAELGLLQPPNGMASTVEEALLLAKQITYPLIVRPSYVLGGRAMEVVYNDEELVDYLERFAKVLQGSPILLDHFLENAIEVDVDAIADGEEVLIAGIMEHIEQAGIHSGDSACCLPPFSLRPEVQDNIRDQMRKMAKALHVVGLINAQFAIQEDKIYVLEVNPRAARTVPFVSKVIGLSLAAVAARCMIGQSLRSQGCLKELIPSYYAVKRSVFPFEKFPGVDPILGPEMRSTGEVMGTGDNFPMAYAKSEWAIQGPWMRQAQGALLSVRDTDKQGIIEVAQKLKEHGLRLFATEGTARVILAAGLPCEIVSKVKEGRPHVVDVIKSHQIAFVINTTEGRQAIADSHAIRRAAVQYKVNYTTTLAGAKAQVDALAYQNNINTITIQALHERVAI